MDPDTDTVQFKAAKSSLLCALLFAVHPIHTESVSIPLCSCKTRLVNDLPTKYLSNWIGSNFSSL